MVELAAGVITLAFAVQRMRGEVSVNAVSHPRAGGVTSAGPAYAVR